VLEDGLIVSAGAIGSSVRDAVDELTTRLRRRLAAPMPSMQDGHGALKLAGRRRTSRQSHPGLRTDRRELCDRVTDRADVAGLQRPAASDVGARRSSWRAGSRRRGYHRRGQCPGLLV
jgi:hypothetical protein